MCDNNSNQRRCAACRYLRRRCSEDCILSPYFPASQPHRFATVHRIFGAGNVARMLQQLPVHERRQAADSLSSEAHWRIQDPVYGSVGIISMLQHQIHMAQGELATTQAQISIYTNHHHHHHHHHQQQQQQQQSTSSPDSTFMDLQQLPDLF